MNDLGSGDWAGDERVMAPNWSVKREDGRGQAQRYGKGKEQRGKGLGKKKGEGV